MAELSKITVVLPSLDPDEKLTAVIDGLLQHGFSDIILVNDGSKPENIHFFTDAAQAHPEVTVLHHEVNRGKGAALKTAFSWFLENRPDSLGVVTVDGDNQHHPEDTRACCLHMLQTGRITLGCRDFTLPQVPARSRFGNKTTSLVFRLFCGIRLSDTQTGLRAFPRDTLELMCRVAGDRFEYETNMLLEMKNHGLPFDEMKIRTVYIEENKSSHFHWLKDSWRIYKLILAHFFRYTLSSLASSILDIGLFTVFARLFSSGLTGLALDAAATGLARIISSLFNFFMNKKVVFRSGVSTKTALVRYYALAIPMMVAQALLTDGATALFKLRQGGFLHTLVYALVMTALYFVSYSIQQRWVFANKNTSRGNKHE